MVLFFPQAKKTVWYLVVLGQYKAVLDDTWWYWVSMATVVGMWYSVSIGSSIIYLVVLGHYKTHAFIQG